MVRVVTWPVPPANPQGRKRDLQTPNGRLWVVKCHILHEVTLFAPKTADLKEYKLEKILNPNQFLQLIGTIKRIIFRKLRTGTVLKLYSIIVLPKFCMGQKIGL
jgi:hypothetical protein